MVSQKAFLMSFLLAITSHLCQREGDASPTPTLSSLAPAGIHEAKNEDCEPVIKSKDLEPRAVINHYAEYYRGFLLYLLREVWGAKGPYTVLEDADKVDGNGLYFFFWSAYPNADDINKQDQIYPLYIGITGRSFKQRFKEHIERGVVNRITSGQWPTVRSGMVNLKIVAYVVDMPLPVAKFFESVFLYAFDFAMNVEENNGERPAIDVITKPRSVEDGWSFFKEAYGQIKSYFTEIDNMVSEKGMEKASTAIPNYQFGH